MDIRGAQANPFASQLNRLGATAPAAAVQRQVQQPPVQQSADASSLSQGRILSMALKGMMNEVLGKPDSAPKAAMAPAQQLPGNPFDAQIQRMAANRGGRA